MNGIRFVHTDHLRLAGSIAGLGATPSWLRRLARDATRGAVSRVFEIARSHDADFIFIGGSCTESEEFQSSVGRWLEKPIRNLRHRGIPVVMTASQTTATERLADIVLHPGNRLHATRSEGQVRLETHSADSTRVSELAVTPELVGPSVKAACNYLFRPRTRSAVVRSSDGQFVYSAGASQSHGPHEQGEFGCLVVNADSDTGQLDAIFESTDPLRFETRQIEPPSVTSSQMICDAVLEESRILARQQRRTTVVDWHLQTPVECTGEIESWWPDTILNSVRSVLQDGHIGVWPRCIHLTPSSVRLPERADCAATRVLTSLLFEKQRDSSPKSRTIFTELITGARLLDRAA